MFNRVVFGTHPAARVSPTAASARRDRRREALVDFHQRALRAGPRARSRSPATSRSPTRASWSKRSSAHGRRPARRSRRRRSAAAAERRRSILIARPGSVQTTLYVGTQSMARTDPDYAALTVVNRVLGGDRWAGCSATCARRRDTPTASAADSRAPLVSRSVDGVDERAHRGHRAGADAICWPRSPSCATSRCRTRSSRTRSARSSAASRCRSRESAAGARLLRRQLAVRSAGRLLGHVSGAHRRR